MSPIKIALKNWQDQHKDIIVEGLTDGPNYVRLATKTLPTLDVVVAARPVVTRVSYDAILLAVKLSVFPVKESIKAMPANDAVMTEWLLSAFPHIKFEKRDQRRVGTLAGSIIPADFDAGKSFIEAFHEADTVERLVAYLEGLLDHPFDNRAAIIEAMKTHFLALLPYVFAKTKQADKPQNLTGDFAAGATIISFADKKAEADQGKAFTAMIEDMAEAEASEVEADGDDEDAADAEAEEESEDDE